jgi:hypothetical protein
MKIMSALRDGLRRVHSAPAVLIGVFVLTFVVALPLGLTLRGMLRDHLGDSLAAEQAAAGVNSEWWDEFSAEATGVGATFSTSVIGFAAVLDNVSSMLDNRAHATVLAAAGAAYLLLWVFLIGGVLDRYARGRPTRAHGFFSACGVYFFRFLRLGLLAGIVYYLLFAYVHTWLLDTFYTWATRDSVVERSAFFVRGSLYLVFGALLVACNLVFDYAKIRAVVEDRRSMIGALLAAARFLRRHASSAVGLYLANGVLFVIVLALYALVAPGAGSIGWSMWLGLAVSQVYLLARLWVKLVFCASQTALFQSALAHAQYTAAPQAVWPESPAAEAIAVPPPAVQG